MNEDNDKSSFKNAALSNNYLYKIMRQARKLKKNLFITKGKESSSA